MLFGWAGEKFGSSLYEYLSLVCQKTQVVLMPLPAYFGMVKGKNGLDIADMFDAKPYLEVDMSGYDTSSYMCLYSYQPSNHLNLEPEDNYMYENDGFDVADTWGEISDMLPSSLTDNTEGEYIIPAFGVTFAKQNQSYFKNIGLNMNNHQITEYSIAATMEIATSASISGNRQTTLYGQDLYSIFSNYSYTCDVESLGNAQILPMMYFQLNNIPMWKGAYMITRVEHNIKAGDMTTNFSGVRLNKNAIPFTNGEAIFIRDNNMLQPEELTGELLKPILGKKVDALVKSNFTVSAMSEYLYDVYFKNTIYEKDENKELCNTYATILFKELPKYGITEAYQIAMFVAQIGHESNRLRNVVEIGSDTYFNKYEGRKTLSNTEPGDGPKFKGRGLIQLTGRDNYDKFGKYVNKDFLTRPELVAQPENAVLSACWYWDTRKLNNYAGNIYECTKKINGGLNGINDRVNLYNKAINEIRKYIDFDNAV
jgi:putative chitinase